MANLPWCLIFQLHIGFELCTYQCQPGREWRLGKGQGLDKGSRPVVGTLIITKSRRWGLFMFLTLEPVISSLL